MFIPEVSVFAVGVDKQAQALASIVNDGRQIRWVVEVAEPGRVCLQWVTCSGKQGRVHSQRGSTNKDDYICHRVRRIYKEKEVFHPGVIIFVMRVGKQGVRNLLVGSDPSPPTGECAHRLFLVSLFWHSDLRIQTISLLHWRPTLSIYFCFHFADKNETSFCPTKQFITDCILVNSTIGMSWGQKRVFVFCFHNISRVYYNCFTIGLNCLEYHSRASCILHFCRTTVRSGVLLPLIIRLLTWAVFIAFFNSGRACISRPSQLQMHPAKASVAACTDGISHLSWGKRSNIWAHYIFQTNVLSFCPTQ